MDMEPHGKRKPARPRTRWMDDVNKDMNTVARGMRKTDGGLLKTMTNKIKKKHTDRHRQDEHCNKFCLDFERSKRVS